MLYFNRIDVSERVDVIKTRKLKECDVCHYWYFLNKGFKFQAYLNNGCHDLLMMSINLSDIAVLNSKGSNYCVLLSELAKMRP